MTRNENKKKQHLNLRKDMSAQDTMSLNNYNLMLGGFILYGLIITILISVFAKDFIMGSSAIVVSIVSVVLVLLGIIVMAISNKTPIIAIFYSIMCVGVGLLVAMAVVFYDLEDIFTAIIAVAFITLIMTIVSYIFPNFFLRLGRVLCLSLLILIVVEIVIILITGILPTIISIISVLIFSLFIGYDWQKSQVIPKTPKNAILSAGELYLDIINIFLDLLQIFADSK